MEPILKNVFVGSPSIYKKIQFLPKSAAIMITYLENNIYCWFKQNSCFIIRIFNEKLILQCILLKEFKSNALDVGFNVNLAYQFLVTKKFLLLSYHGIDRVYRNPLAQP